VKYLLGFYRKHGEMKALYGASPTFRDKGLLRAEYRAEIVPLALINNTQPWQLTEDMATVGASLKSVLLQNQLFCTAKTATSPFYLLMYMQVSDSRMGRGGVLLEKKGDQYHPVLVEIEGIPYLVELKGVGCPTGGFPDFHRRKQAGTERYHVRVTGGMGWAGALGEFRNLERMRPMFPDFPDGHHLRALGVAPFTLKSTDQTVNAGLLIRLSPSSIRFGFYENPAFKQLNTLNNQVFAQNAGFETAKFLSGKTPSVHRNIGWNNMLYVSPGNYILTDYEELTSLAEGHCNLDLLEQVYPIYLNFYPFRTLWFSDFLKGFKDFGGALSGEINQKTSEGISGWNRHILHRLGPTIFQQRVRSGIDLRFLQDNLNALRAYMPSSYFQQPVRKWAATSFLDTIATQLAILPWLIDFAKEEGLESLNKGLMEREANRETHPLIMRMTEKNPVLAKFLLGKEQDPRFGDYLYRETFLTQFLKPASTVIDLQLRVAQLQDIQAQAARYIQTGKLDVKQDYVTELFALRNALTFFDMPLYLFPFLGFLSTWFENESLILHGAAKTMSSLTPREKGLLSKSLKALAIKKQLLRSDPTAYHKHMCKSDSTFIKEAQLPYQCPRT